MAYHSAGPSKATGQANQPRLAINPYLWVPSPEIQKQIQTLVYHHIFSGTGVKRDEMRTRISYRLASISFDENLKPHLVFPAFWTYETFSGPLISVRPANGTSLDWDRCYRELRKEVLEPQGLHDVSVMFTNGVTSQFHGPRSIRVNGQLIRMGSNPDIKKLLETRISMLRTRASYPMAQDQVHFLQLLLPLFTGLLDHGVISVGGIQEYIHRH
ncbi:hypothetical protein F5Y12DRAFT_800549 [Xylaria sp. FL1777]|nr:hypothetical protein F5Y12DRAFT_800549 [Xylaria sp. FL1777]